MSDDFQREPDAILEALAVLGAETPEEALEVPSDPALPPEEAEARATLRRLSVETLGLLAYDAEPAEPRAGARDRLLANLRSRRRPETGDDTRVLPLQETPGTARAGHSAARAPASSARPAAPAPGPTPGGAPRRLPWLAALAASLLLLAVAGLAGWLWLELDRTRAAVARLDAERERLVERLDSQEELVRRVGASGGLLAAVATPGVEVCTLRPVGDPPMMPGAYAVLYMPPGSDEWYLLASNLESDRGVYRVWLNTPDGPVAAGVLQPGEAETLELRLPPPLAERHDLLLSISVTVEPSTETPEPEGPMVLFGDEKMTVL